jgi:hypothetical protein
MGGNDARNPGMRRLVIEEDVASPVYLSINEARCEPCASGQVAPALRKAIHH